MRDRAARKLAVDLPASEHSDLVGQAVTPKSLLPGESVDVEWTVDLGGAGAADATYYVTVDDPSLVDECIETNNIGVVGGGDCGKL